MKTCLSIRIALAGALGIAMGFAAISEASAAVCAGGPYRAGCAGPRGAIVGNRDGARGYAYRGSRGYAYGYAGGARYGGGVRRGYAYRGYGRRF
jgi:hypothetical protein